MTRLRLSPGIAAALALTLAACSDDSLDNMQSDDTVGIAGGARSQNTLLPPNTEILDLRTAP
ncbi:MAG: hypothetical protein ACPG1A_10240, partial [Halioglobus sp.]